MKHIKLTIILSFLILCLLVGYQNCGQVNLDQKSSAGENKLPNYMSLNNDENKTHKILSYDCGSDYCDLAIVNSSEYNVIQLEKGKSGGSTDTYPAVEYDFVPSRKIGDTPIEESLCKAISYSVTSKVILQCPLKVFEGKGFFIEP